jgi:hypothetical protein
MLRRATKILHSNKRNFYSSYEPPEPENDPFIFGGVVLCILVAIEYRRRR